MNRLHLLMASALAGTCMSATAASFDYEILVVTCDAKSCSRLAERTIVAGSDGKAAFRQGDFRLEIETLASRSDAMDAKVSLDFAPAREDTAGGRPRGDGNQRVQVLVEPCTLKLGVFSSLAALASEGKVYRAWVRLAAR